MPAAAAHPFLDLHPEVAAALAAGRPVVALESTIISHGMPWPQNAETALAVQAEVRAHGAVPATTAVVDGRLVAGLSDAQIAQLARAGTATPKASPSKATEPGSGTEFTVKASCIGLSPRSVVVKPTQLPPLEGAAARQASADKGMTPNPIFGKISIS